MLGGKFSFVSDNEVKCKYCEAVFKYHNSVSSLSYHLRNKHPFSASAPSCEPSVAGKRKSDALTSSGTEATPGTRQTTLLETANQRPTEQ